MSKILLCQNRVFSTFFWGFFSLQKWRTGFCKNHFDTDHSSVPKFFWKKSPYKVVATFFHFLEALFCNFDTAEFLSIFTRVFKFFEKKRIFTFQKVDTCYAAVLEKFQNFEKNLRKKKILSRKCFLDKNFCPFLKSCPLFCFWVVPGT